MAAATVTTLVVAPQVGAQPLKAAAGQGRSVSLQEGLRQLKPEARKCLSRLPADVQQVFVNLEPNVMQWMLQKVEGTTWVSMVPISNRDALVTGSVLGTDVFERVRAGLKEQVAEGAIPAQLESRISNLLIRLKSLSPDQRDSLIQALEKQQR
ncbi:hypothetical protein IV102_31795 [bacterium]|nr:hypothetical protein [bacterium]